MQRIIRNHLFLASIYILMLLSKVYANIPELSESPLGISGVGFLTRLYYESSKGNPLSRSEIQRRFMLIDSLDTRWVRVDAGLGTLLPDLAIDKQTGDTIEIWCSTPVDFSKVTPIFRFSLIESTFVNLWKINVRPLLILDYGASWMSSDTCIGFGEDTRKRCYYQFLPKGKAWLWFLKNLKDSLDKLILDYKSYPVSKPVYLEVWNEPNIFLYHNSLYDCTKSEKFEEGVKCEDEKTILPLQKPRDSRKRPCYVGKIYQLYVDSLLIPVLEVFGKDPNYRVIATGPGVDPVWESTQPSWFVAFKVMAERLREYRIKNSLSVTPAGIAIHWYHHQGKDSEDSGIKKHFLSILETTRDTLSKYAPNLGLDTLVMWITEFGRYTYNSFEKTERGSILMVSLDKHFNTLASMYEVFFNRHMRRKFKLGPGFLFSLIDLPGTEIFFEPAGHFGLASREYLSLAEKVPWDRDLKPSAYFYRDLSEAWNLKYSTPLVDKKGIRPNLWTPIVVFRGRIFVSFKGYQPTYEESSLEIVRIPQLYVVELNENAEIVDFLRLTNFEESHPELTVPTLRVFNGEMFIAYALSDSVFIWKFNNRWSPYKRIYTGIVPKTPFFWLKNRLGGFIYGENEEGNIIAEITESANGEWKTKVLFLLGSSDFMPLFTDFGFWLWDRDNNKVLVLTDSKEAHSLSLDSLTMAPKEIGVSALKNKGKLLLTTEKSLTVAKLVYNNRDYKWSIKDTMNIILPSPRYQSFAYGVTKSGDVSRDLNDWIVVVDTLPVDDVPSRELYRYKSRSTILRFSANGSKFTSKPIYSSPLFIRFPFAVRFRSNLILGFLEGAYDHYILKFRILRL